MSMQWVRDTYGVPAKRGMRVVLDGEPGRILSATHHLHLRLDSGRHVWAHPTWRIEYPEAERREGRAP